jgi:hypothetical protein
VSDDTHARVIALDTQIFELDNNNTIIVEYFIPSGALLSNIVYCYIITLLQSIGCSYCDAKSFFFFFFIVYDAAQFQCAVFAYHLISSTSIIIIIYARLVNIPSRFFCIWSGKIKIESIKLCVLSHRRIETVARSLTRGSLRFYYLLC